MISKDFSVNPSPLGTNLVFQSGSRAEVDLDKELLNFDFPLYLLVDILIILSSVPIKFASLTSDRDEKC